MLRLFNPQPPYLSFLREMDRLSEVIDYCGRMIRKISKKQEQSYWTDRWNVAVHLHMEFEWSLHPGNPERLDFNLFMS